MAQVISDLYVYAFHIRSFIRLVAFICVFNVGDKVFLQEVT